MAQTAPSLPSGSASALVAAGSGLCITLQGDVNGDGVPVMQDACTGRAAQAWQFQASQTAGQYRIVNAATGRCLDNAGAEKVADGMRLGQNGCGGDFAVWQRWTVSRTSAGTAIVNAYSGRCVTVEGGSNAAGGALTQRACTGSAQQSWNPPATVGGTSVANGASGSSTGLNLAAGTGSGQLKAAHSGMCLAAPAGDGSDGSAIRQQPCGGGTEQIWDAAVMGGGFRLVNRGNGKCLNLYGGLGNDGTAIQQYTCAGRSNEAWSGRAQNGGYALVSAATGKCLDILGASTAAGAPTIQWTCHGGANQTFSSSAGTSSAGAGAGAATGLNLAAGTGSGQLKAAHSGMCLAAPAGNASDGSAIRQQPCGSGTEQIWDAAAMSGGFRLVNRSNGKCLNLYGGLGDDGTAIQQYTCGGRSNEAWSGRAQKGGYALVSAATGKCLDVLGGSTAAGTQVVQWTCHGSANQTFTSPAGTSSAGTGAGAAIGGGTTTGTSGGTGAGTGPTASGTPPGEVAPTGNVLLINRQSGMCVSISGGQASAGQKSQQTACRAAASESWTFVSVGTGYQIRNAASGLCLFSDQGLTTNGPSTVQQACNASADGGRWQIRKIDQWFEIVGIQSGRCMAVTDGSREDGATLSQWDCTSGDSQRFTIISATLAPSSWTAPRSIGIVPVSAAPLPNGKLLMWAGDGRNSFGDGTSMWTTLYDPATNGAVEANVTNAGQMFCPGTNVLPDGRILTNGGRNPGGTSIYDPATNTWSRAQGMNIPRGYNGNTTLSTGETLTYGGSWSGDGGSDKFGEVWSPGTGQWRVLRNVSSEPAAMPYPKNRVFRDNHYWVFAAANGWAFNPGPSPNMFWIDTRGNGALNGVGTRGDDEWSQSATATMYDVGRILKMGGAPGGQNEIANDNAYTIDITAGPGSVPQVVKLAPPPFARVYANSVVLPNGEVVTIGGQTVQAQFTDARSVMLADIWSPQTGKFRLLAPIAVGRNYHSWAVLMPDGRIASGGGGLCACAGDHYDFQFLTPPYLYDASGKLAARPTITAAPGSAAAGASIGVTTDRSVTSFALVRMSATTHTVNADQRRVPLTIASSGSTTYQLTLPAERGVLLPGPWMLFAMDANGVPSIAKIVRIQ